jgi:cell division protease FtsH
MATEFGMSPALGPLRLAGDPQAAFLGPQAWGLDNRVSQETAGQVDAETRRFVEEALEIATVLLRTHRVVLDRLAERLCQRETVNGSEVTTMLAEAEKMAQDDGSLAPDGTPWQDASFWHEKKASPTHHSATADSVPPVEASPGNGHEPKRGPNTR